MALGTFKNRYGEQQFLSSVIDEKTDCFTYDGLSIIKLKGIQKLANASDVVEKKFEMCIQPTDGNKQQHGVNIWVGFKDQTDMDSWARASGEASMLNTGKLTKVKNAAGGEERRYSEHDSIDSKFRFAMADKRAYCRAVLKLLQITDMYSEIESPDFLGAAKADYNF